MRNHPNWIKAYMNYSRLQEAPDQFHLWSAIATVAGALRGKVWFDMGHFRWRPNFFIILVGPPAIQKSTTAGVGIKLLREIEDIRFGPNSITWQALIPAMAEANMQFPLTKDGIAGEMQNFSCLTILASELGTLLNMKEVGLVDALTDLWDGDLASPTWAKATMTYKVTIENPWIHIIAGTTPVWIAENISKKAMSGGFVSRCVFVYGDEKRRLSAYPKKEAQRLGISTRDEAIPLVEDLRAISKLVGEFDLSLEAEHFGEEWYISHNHRAKEIQVSDITGYMTRKQAHLHKVAMVVSAAKSDRMVITREDLEESMQLLEMTEGMMPQVFADIHANVEMTKAQRILDFLNSIPKKRCPRHALYRHFLKEMSTLEFAGFIDALQVSGEIEIQDEMGILFFRVKEKTK